MSIKIVNLGFEVIKQFLSNTENVCQLMLAYHSLWCDAGKISQVIQPSDW